MTGSLWSACRDVMKRAKGTPCGIPMPEHTARAMVAADLARWAPPMFLYPVPVFCVSLTYEGKALARSPRPHRRVFSEINAEQSSP